MVSRGLVDPSHTLFLAELRYSGQISCCKILHTQLDGRSEMVVPTATVSIRRIVTSGLPTILPRLPRSAFLASDGRLSGYATHQDFKKPYSFA